MNTTKRHRVISASRTKDMVRCSPEVLASILTGEADCTFGPRAPRRTLDAGEIHTLVLWTKDPANITENPELAAALGNLVEGGGQLFLQLTVTALGGSPLEIGVPRPEAVSSCLKDGLLPSGLLVPGAVKLRYDPLLEVTCGGSKLGNMSRQDFERILHLFRPLGISRFVTSYVDYLSYPRIKRRLGTLGLEFVEHSENEIVDFVGTMLTICHANDSELQTCCNPPVANQESGCIDGRLLNRLMDEAGRPDLRCTTEFHNSIGKQRPRCRCTYSHDIGYSAGVTQCYSQGGGCLYCYSQPESINEKLRRKVISGLEELRRS